MGIVLGFCFACATGGFWFSVLFVLDLRVCLLYWLLCFALIVLADVICIVFCCLWVVLFVLRFYFFFCVLLFEAFRFGFVLGSGVLWSVMIVWGFCLYICFGYCFTWVPR